MTGHPERLTLPEPVRTLWPDCHALLERFFSDHDTIDGGYVVGGGTILAARLGHRTSFDIDPIITSRPDLLEYFEGAPRHGTIRQAMTEFGFTSAEEHPPLQLTLLHPLGKLDLFTSIPFPEGPTTFAEIDGTRVAVATNLQIMTGKLRGRVTRAPVRDLIDVAVTATADRGACQRAINAIPADTLAAIPKILTQRRELYRQQSAKDDVRLADAWQHLNKDPARHAVEAIRALAWQRIDLTYAPEGAFFTAYEGETTRVLDPEPITDPRTFDRRMHELGIRYARRPGTDHSHGAHEMLRAMATQNLTVVRAKEVKFADTSALEQTRTATPNPGPAPPPSDAARNERQSSEHAETDLPPSRLPGIRAPTPARRAKKRPARGTGRDPEPRL